MKTGTSTTFEFGPGYQGAEPFFIPRQSARSEDDGFLMTYVFDQARQASDLFIIDALDLDRPALAQIHLPVRVPFGFHGSWVSDEEVHKS